MRPPGAARVALVITCSLAAALALFFGTGLHPHPWLTWWVPLPLLLLVGRVSTRVLVGAAMVTGMAGGSNLWSYGTATLSMPAPVVGGYLVGEGLLLGLVVLVFDRLARGGHLLGAAVAAPAVWVVGEWLAAGLSPNGAFLSLAYSQAGWRLPLAIVSLTGVWGLSYLILAVPVALAALVHSGRAHRSLVQVGTWLVALVTVAAAYGAWYSSGGGHAAQTIDVGLVVVKQPYDPVDVTSPRGRELLTSYRSAAARLAMSGATLVVAPEKAWRVSAAATGAFVATWRGFAVSRHVDVVLGVLLDHAANGGPVRNVAMLFPASGAKPAIYSKQHLIPSYESSFTAGNRSVEVADEAGLIGLAVCKDMDFPGLSRSSANAGAGLLAVPAWDFTADAWLHSRIAVTAGVATGLSVARTARDGALTVSEPDGTVVAETRTGTATVTSVRAMVPFGTHKTLYDAWGDWFAWLCFLVVAGGLVGGRRFGSRTSSETAVEPADSAGPALAASGGHQRPGTSRLRRSAYPR